GKKGVEKEYDKEMKGQDGVEDVEVDVHGNVIKEIKNVSSITGKNIYLSIDLDLQALPCVLVRPNLGVHFEIISMTIKTDGICVGQRDSLLRIQACCMIAAENNEGK
ncbi:MAG: hypothetical protein ACFNM7_03265, partial [Prevotella conceptionensis]